MAHNAEDKSSWAKFTQCRQRVRERKRPSRQRKHIIDWRVFPCTAKTRASISGKHPGNCTPSKLWLHRTNGPPRGHWRISAVWRGISQLAHIDERRTHITTWKRAWWWSTIIYDIIYRSELGGICAGLAVIGVRTRSECINIRSVRLVCNNEAAVKRCNQKLTSSIYHNTESDWGLLKTFHILQDEWCKEIPTQVQWVKGHADKENREMTWD
jgi:hypothetical protein